MHEVEDHRRREERRVHEHVLVEEDVADVGDVSESRDPVLRERLHLPRRDVLGRERGRETEGEDVEEDPRDDLIRSEPHVEQGEHDSAEDAGADGDQQS